MVAPRTGAHDQLVSPADVEAFERDGVVCLRGAIPLKWLEALAADIETMIEKAAVDRYEPDGQAGGNFFGLGGPNKDYSGFRDFALHGPAGQIAGELTRSSAIRFYTDQVFSKEPGSEAATPWHQDLPYWPVEGENICTVWVPLDPVTKTTGAVSYVRGSHRWGRRFAPRAFFGNPENFAGSGLEEVPNVDDVFRHELVSFATAPGDCIVHDALTLHGAPGNASAEIRRRADALRFVGEHTIYVGARLSNWENPYPDLVIGNEVDDTNFPVVWTSAAVG